MKGNGIVDVKTYNALMNRSKDPFPAKNYPANGRNNPNKKKDTKKKADKGTGQVKKPSSTTTTSPKAPTPTPKKDTGSGGILPDAVGLRWSQAASAGGGVAASQDVLVSKNGVNVYGSVEGNLGVQGGADLSSQLVLAWGTPDGIAGKYQSANLTLVWGIGIDIQYSWSDTSKVFAIGPALGAKIQGSYGRGITVR